MDRGAFWTLGLILLGGYALLGVVWPSIYIPLDHREPPSPYPSRTASARWRGLIPERLT